MRCKLPSWRYIYGGEVARQLEATVWHFISIFNGFYFPNLSAYAFLPTCSSSLDWDLLQNIHLYIPLYFNLLTVFNIIYPSKYWIISLLFFLYFSLIKIDSHENLTLMCNLKKISYHYYKNRKKMLGKIRVIHPLSFIIAVS